MRHHHRSGTKYFFVFAVMSVSANLFSQPPEHPDQLTHFSSIGSADSTSMMSRSPADPPLRWYSMISNLPADITTWGGSAFRHENLEAWLAIGGTTGVLFLLDDVTYTPSRKLYDHSAAVKYWSEYFSNIGDGRGQFFLAGSFGAFGLVTNDPQALRTGSEIVEVVLASGAVVQALKHLTGRESPYVRTSPTGVWKFFPNQIDYHKHVPHYDAFPSGHICTSLATMIVIANNYPDQKWIAPLGYGITSLIGIGMVNKGIHWYSDYPLGLFLGYSFGTIVSHSEKTVLSRGNLNEPVTISLQPSVTGTGTGIGVTVNF